MKRLWRRTGRAERQEEPEAPTHLRVEAERGRKLVEESREVVVVLDEDDRVVASSRRARESFPGLQHGVSLTERALTEDGKRQLFRVPYEVDGRRETIVYLRDTGDLAAYEELRAGFTAAVSHELRTPLARLLALLETALLPDADMEELIEQARAEIDQIRELIDDVLFLSELESGRELVALGSTRALPTLSEVARRLGDKAARAGVTIAVAGNDDIELPLRPRMLAVIAENLAENAISYAGPGSTFTLSARRERDTVVLAGADDGVGVNDDDLPRLFERFYRADQARSSRGTGLGLAIVKHVTASAGGTVAATGARGRGLSIRCIFPAS